jgi:hypothetical protein
MGIRFSHGTTQPGRLRRLILSDAEPMTFGWRPVAAIVWLAATLLSCDPAAGRTDPAFDWEKIPAQPPRYTHPVPAIDSTRTLEQTTKWLRWALERYGTGVRPTVYRSDVRDVRFRECSMEWSVNEELGNGMTRLRSHELHLGTITGARGFRGYTTVDLSQPPRVTERIFEKGQEKPSTPVSERHVQLPLRDEDQISHRISWALRHAGRLCAGAR